MTLRTRLFFGSAVMGLCLLVVASTTVYTLVGISRSMEEVEEEYEERIEIGDIRVQLGSARAILSTASPNIDQFKDQLTRADATLAHYIAGQSDQEAGDQSHQDSESAAAQKVRDAIQEIMAQLDSSQGNTASVLDSVNAELDLLSKDLGQLLGETDEQVSNAGSEAQRELRYGLTLFGIITLAALVFGISGAVYTYRSVLGPVRQLRDQIRSASRSLNGSPKPLPPSDDLSAIRSDFIDVVEELDALYHTLEDRVNNKSRELVRAERLASVGYLAAGIAHEINNPLNAISGYSEIVSRDLAKSSDASKWEESIESLAIVQREAMRCKGITDRLLSLSRKSTEAQECVNLARVVKQAVELINGLPHLSGRSIKNHLMLKDNLMVWGVASELSQVFLNLMVNAIEACEPARGVIKISGRQDQETVAITIRDNGMGMTPQTLKHLFEPFFTHKRGQQEAGTGLGMSIVHAIALDYGGSVKAHSDGVGKGTTITVTLPVSKEETHHE